MYKIKSHILVSRVLLFILLFPLVHAQAQTVNCKVAVNHQLTENTNQELFQEMKTAVTEFVNQNTWANISYPPSQRIACNFLFTIKEQVGDNEFKGVLQIQSQRPVYQSSYQSPILNVIDNDLTFRFSAAEPLEFNEQSHISNLTSILAYWVYVVVGMDMDTFSPMGGSEVFKMAERVVSNAATDASQGWRSDASNKKNRYWLLENLLSPNYAPIRKAMYTYHRTGLDVMSDDAAKGRNVVQGVLKDELAPLYTRRPDMSMYLYLVFFDAKADELVNVFSEAPAAEKKEVYNLLNTINGQNSQKYQRLK